MAKETSQGEPQPNDEVHTVVLGVPFKPYERAERFARAGTESNPFLVPEDYGHKLALRRPVSLYGMTGCIDIITENPREWLAPLLRRRPLEKPLGDTLFRTIYAGPDDQQDIESPLIMRLSFLARTPAQYAQLLDSFAEVKLGNEKYMAVWNLYRSTVKKNLHRLENGEELLIVENNLFNMKGLGKDDDPEEEFPEDDFGRVTYVWLPANLENLRTIEVKIDRLKDDDPKESPEPIQPNQQPIHLLK